MRERPGGARFRIGLCAFWLGLAAAGAGAAAEPAHADEGDLVTVSASSGAEVRNLSGGILSVALLAVLSDERCPAETMCAWARPPVVVLRLSRGGRSASVRLDVGPAQRDVAFEGWTIRGADLLPRPRKTEQFGHLKPLNLYRLVLHITP